MSTLCAKKSHGCDCQAICLRSVLVRKCDEGLLGVVAARTRVSEGAIYSFITDDSATFGRSELESLSELVLMEETQTYAAALTIDDEPRGYDPYNSARS